jgi:hypothetical protein
MHLGWMAVWVALVSMAAAPAADVLQNYVPEDLGRVHRSGDVVQLDANSVTATYLDLESRRTITVGIASVPDPAAARAKYKVWGEAEGTLKASDAEYGGFVIGGIPGGYFWSESAGTLQSEAAVLLGDQLVVRVAVQPAKDPTEPIRLMRGLDLDGLRKLVP